MNKRIIYKNAEGGISIVFPNNNSGLSIEAIAAKDIPTGVAYDIVDVSIVPSNRIFRNAWDINSSKVVTDVVKAKVIAHDIRRTKRDEEFAPHDEVIMKQIPGKDLVAAEAARAVIRTKYDNIQIAVDAAITEYELKVALGI